MKKSAKKIIIFSVLLVAAAAVIIGALQFNTSKNWKFHNNKISYVDSDGKNRVGWTTIDGRPYYFNPDGTLADNVKVIDVSTHQGDVDWKTVAGEGIKMAMIRSGYGWENYPSQVDNNLYKNLKGAKAAGLKVGIYHYSYATNEEEARKEAEYCLRAIKDQEVDLPIAYDVEEDEHSKLTKSQLTDLTCAFCDKIREAGYLPMVYTKLELLKSKLDYNRLKSYDLWIAQYATSCDFDKPYLMWQYTKTGLISGVEGYVDFSYYYFDKTVPK